MFYLRVFVLFPSYFTSPNEGITKLLSAIFSWQDFAQVYFFFLLFISFSLLPDAGIKHHFYHLHNIISCIYIHLQITMKKISALLKKGNGHRV